MSKGSNYFSHDYNTRSDEKVKLLIRKHGMLGYGVFWSIVEDLYQNENSLLADYEGIAYDLRIDQLVVKSIIEDFALFTISDGRFSSKSVQRRIESRDEKAALAKKAATKRWDAKPKQIHQYADAMQTHTKNDADALQSECTSNAIKGKESKGKEIKEKESKDVEESTSREALVNVSIPPQISQKNESSSPVNSQTGGDFTGGAAADLKPAVGVPVMTSDDSFVDLLSTEEESEFQNLCKKNGLKGDFRSAVLDFYGKQKVIHDKVWRDFGDFKAHFWNAVVKNQNRGAPAETADERMRRERRESGRTLKVNFIGSKKVE